MTTLRRHLALVAPLLLALSSEPPLGGQLGPVGTQFWSAGSPDLVTSPQALALLGSALAAGDFDCDGFDDLAVGVPDDDDNNGALADVGFVLMVYGGAGGLVAADHQVWDQQSVEQEVEEVGDGFGFALAVGRFAGHSGHDLAIGAPGETVSSEVAAGAWNVVYSEALFRDGFETDAHCNWSSSVGAPTC